MPVRLDGTARLRDGTRLFRRFRYGRLLELSMLDLRSYRDGQLEVPGHRVDAADRTIAGAEQLGWLKDGLSSDAAQWKVIGNPVMIAPVELGSLPHDLIDPVNDVTGLLPRDGFAYNVDQWDGYAHDRREVLEHIRDHQVNDALFITGDIHSGWACELPYDASTLSDPLAIGDSAGVEFVCSSVTSNNLKDITGSPARTTSVAVENVIRAANRHVRYLDFDSHGFSVLDVTATRAQMDWYVIGDRADRATPITWSVSYQTRTGTGRIERVEQPVGG